jgi:hypothetical protein
LSPNYKSLTSCIILNYFLKKLLVCNKCCGWTTAQHYLLSQGFRQINLLNCLKAAIQFCNIIFTNYCSFKFIGQTAFWSELNSSTSGYNKKIAAKGGGLLEQSTANLYWSLVRAGQTFSTLFHNFNFQQHTGHQLGSDSSSGFPFCCNLSRCTYHKCEHP